MKRIFSGIQPTGNLHLGNYLGAIRNWVGMQQDFDFNCIFCIVDLHAITVPQDPAELAANTREVTAAYIASGIDPKRCIVFNQSMVSAHSELAWVLNCHAPMGWLNRMTQFKEKAGKRRDAAAVGLFAYPVLMAADILLYRASDVPVGEDQKQHLELSRDIAGAFNRHYDCEAFVLPEPRIFGAATRVMSLRDGAAKMSKSDPSAWSRINLSDDADAIAQKIRRAKTDPEALPSEPAGLEGRPEAENLVGIHAALAGVDEAAVCREFGGRGFADFKAALSELAVEVLSPVTAEMRRLTADPGYIDGVLADGAARAGAIASATMRDIREIVGFLTPGSKKDIELTSRPKQLARIGESYLQEAILDVLRDNQPTGFGLGPAEVSRRTGIYRGAGVVQMNDATVAGLLNQLHDQGKVERADQANGRGGWRLAE